jgi:hypothetical protein
MTSILNFESNVYSEELYSVSEQEYDEVMAANAANNGWQGYSEWSRDLEQVRVVAESENFIAYSDGTVRHKPEPKSNGRLEGIEL